MRTIHKYVLSATTETVNTHEGARFIHAANQYDQITVWADVATSEPEVERVLHVVGTGNAVPTETAAYVGTALMAGGEYVFHVYAEPDPTTAGGG